MELNMGDVEKRLDAIETKLDGISVALSKIAVQNERITHLQGSVTQLWEKCDKASERIGEIQQFQAGCPKESVGKLTAWLWGLTVSMLLIIIGVLMRGSVQ